MIKTILYDLDGVLVDACEWHYIALNQALKQISYTTISRTEHEVIFNALPTNKKLDILIQQNRVNPINKEAIFNLKQDLIMKIIDEKAIIQKEKIELHSFIKSMKIQSICVTNSIYQTAHLMLEKTGQLPYISQIISNEMVKNPKPHGEGYIKAMILTNTMPDECIIVEDSEKGLKAAYSTGAHVWKVKNSTDVNLHNFKNFIGDLK
jgi:HAD superfamily hydrolase (TIGR01509 family)